MILVKMTNMVEFITFRPTRPAGRLGLAARLSAAEPTLVASDPMLGAPHRAQGVPDRDLGATGPQPRGYQFATSRPPVRGLGTRGTGKPSDE